MAQVENSFPQSCPTCGAGVDASDQEPLSAIPCPVCGAHMVVASSIDHFELQEEIGRGGMGIVYRALDTSLDRLVALKLIRKQELENPDQIAQLEMEAMMTASISHPHVVKVFTTGMDHGRFYIAMELVSQGTLANLIDMQGSVPEIQALEYGIQAAKGLRAAQEAGLIHRDVKPGNILFADSRTAKIVDFGLATFLGEEPGNRGEIWGTPYYIAPEKLDNKPEDFRSDIYSLGGTLFHALSGRPPFEADNASMVALKHLKSQAVSLQAFAPWVSSWTSYAINRTLNKDPDQRYQSYDELIEHLEYAWTELQTGGGKSPESTRIVLETEGEKRAMGLIVSGMISLILLLGALAFIYRDRVFNGAKPPEPGLEEKSASMFPQACGKFADGDAAGAAAAFREAGRQLYLPQPKLNWANLLEGLSDLAAGQAAASNVAFKAIQERGLYSNKPDDQALASFFLTASQHMINQGAINPSVTAGGHSDNYEAILPLLYAVKDWNLGKFDDSVALFRQFRQTKPANNEAWIADLEPFVTARMDEYTAYQMAADRYNSANTIPNKKSAIKILENVKGNFEKQAQVLITKGSDEIAADEAKRAQLAAGGVIPDDTYFLINRKSGRAIDVPYSSHADGCKLGLYFLSKTNNQKWSLAAIGDGNYQIIALCSGRALNVPESQTADGVVITQNSVVNAPSERWKIERTDGKYYRIVAVCSGKALSFSDDPSKVSKPLIQTAYTGAPEQQWKLELP